MLIVGFDDVLHQLVADHVAFVEVDEFDTLDVSQNLPNLDQTGDPFGWKIYLSDITGDNCLGMEPKSRQKHFHLLRRGVLRFVENDERIVQCAAAHKSERRNFDVAPFDRARGPLHIHHVEQRVVERAEIGIHFGVHIARQKSKLLARFNSRPSENDAAHFLLQQRAHGHSHCQIGLTRSGWTDSNDDVVRLDSFYIGFLRRRFGRDKSFFGDNSRRVGEEFFDRSLGALPERTQRMGNVVRLEHHPVVGEGRKFCEDTFRVAGGVWRTVEGEFFSARREAHTKVFFDQLKMPVVVTEQNGSIGAFSKFKFTHKR